MMKHFGIPYMGSKDKIALDILRQLPKGERFVNLFGGGFAMSHAALLSDRYNYVLYNDFNILLPELITNAIKGKYSYKNFRPDFISREEFDKLKDADGYVKYIWSFGNKGTNYLFGKDVEPVKRAAHNFVVFGARSPMLDKLVPDLQRELKGGTIKARRLALSRAASKESKRLQHIERIERLQQLQQLERLQQFLEVRCGDYRDYEYKDGDVVYLDPPYEGTADYGDAFNHQEFYEWCITRPYQVWFSSYKISDDRFKLVWAKQLRGVLGRNNNPINFECLYTNK